MAGKPGLAILLMGKKGKAKEKDEDEESGEHEITDGMMAAAGSVRSAMKGDDDEKLAQALCDFLDVKGSDY